MSARVEQVQDLWGRIATADTALAVAKTVCVDVPPLFGLHGCVVEFREPDGRPFLFVDSVAGVTDDHRLAFMNSDLWRIDPLFVAILEYGWPAGEDVIDVVRLMELARQHGYTGHDLHTLLLPLFQPGELIGTIRCGGLEPLTKSVQRDLAVMATQVSLRLTQLGARMIPGTSSLTPRQHEIARLAASGRTNAQIAAALAISENTVKTQLKTVFTRLGVWNRTELSVAYRRAPLVDQDIPIGLSHDGALTITRASHRAAPSRQLA
jgi:DNA-binding CsgD family transcriptional regulator